VPARSVSWLALPKGEVHIWPAQPTEGGIGLAKLARTLSADEQQRAAEFRFARDRDRFTRHRGLLRTVLSWYLSLEPAEIRFSYGRSGKPSLDHRVHARPLHFNLAHAGDVALLAVSRRRVGVDVELMEPLPDLAGIAARFLSRRESALIRRLPESRRLSAFFRAWTRKEAILKAAGEGLGREGEAESTRIFRVVSIVPTPGLLGAVAAEGDNWRVRWLDLATDPPVPH
jgi:4'-phosphopantetheinyl transferase